MRIVEKTITFDVAEALEDMGKEEIYDLISEIESDQYDLLLYFFQKIIDELVELGATDTKMLTETLEDTFKGATAIAREMAWAQGRRGEI